MAEAYRRLAVKVRLSVQNSGLAMSELLAGHTLGSSTIECSPLSFRPCWSFLCVTAFSALGLALQHFARAHCLDILGLGMRCVARNRFPLQNLSINSTASPLRRVIALKTQIGTSPHHRKVMKAKPSRMIPSKLTANLEILIVSNSKRLKACKYYS